MQTFLPHPSEQPPAPPAPTSTRLIFTLAIFLSAFLLFQIQLIMAKFLLPWFGGASSVWATCMLFYQVLLLAGYWYADRLSRRPEKGQARTHLWLIVSAVLAIAAARALGWGILPGAAAKPSPDAGPITGILLRLALAIGLPFFLLSSTAPLLQHWYAKLSSSDSGSPYHLYALSNAGSLLALLTYPGLFEPWLRLRFQGLLWLVLFAFVALCLASCASKMRGFAGARLVSPATQQTEHIGFSRRALWFLLSACGSALLLATTNILTQDVAPIPLLWILPLAVYLLTFISVFQPVRIYRRGLFHPLFAVAATVAIVALFRATDMDSFPQIAAFLFALFLICMVCHGELWRSKPPETDLTFFYLTIAAGGAAGGLFVAVVAPLAFPALWEYHISLIAAGFATALALVLDRDSWLYDARPEPGPTLALLVGIAALPLYLGYVGLIEFPQAHRQPYIFALVVASVLVVWLLFSGGPEFLRRREFRWNEVGLIATLVFVTLALVAHLRSSDGMLLVRERNFYGAITVRQETDALGKSYFELMHGRITHGLQYQHDRKLPTTYYTRDSGAGLALENNFFSRFGGIRVGVVGLGAGTLAAYARPGDYYRFYEINPAVLRIARDFRYFSYLHDAGGVVEVALGDARLSMEAEAARGELQRFDVLLIDAFSGDAIPVHLLTREAMALYLQHMRGPESVIGMHTSNINVDLRPVVAGLAEEFKLSATLVETEEKSATMLRSDWVLLSRGTSLYAPAIKAVGKPIIRPVFGKKPPLWTDDYSNVISLMGAGE